VSNPLGSGICGDGNPDQAPAGRKVKALAERRRLIEAELTKPQ
jgi:hypothetical protein